MGHLHGTITQIEGEIAAAERRHPDARASFNAAKRLFEARGAQREVVELDLRLAALELDADREQAARAHVNAGRALLGQLEASDLTHEADRVEAALDVAAGRPLQARSTLEALIDRIPADQHHALADCHRLLAQIYATASAPALAEQHRREARALWERVAVSLQPSARPQFWRHPRRQGLEAPAPTAGPLGNEDSSGSAWRHLATISQRINSTLSVSEVLASAMDAAIELTGAERGLIVLLDEPDAFESYTVEAARNLARQDIDESALEFSTSIATRTMRGDSPIVTVDANADARFRGNASVHAMRLKSVACVPIRSPDGVLGALYLDNRLAAGRFMERDVDILLAFGTQVAIALSNARLHAELQSRAKELEKQKRAVERLSRGQEREIERLSDEVRNRQAALERRFNYERIVGRSPEMERVFDQLDRVIDTDLSVLISGESGTGKELIARAVHYNSPRKNAHFVSINCGALPEHLLESELFGHVRGAFTGADRERTGLMLEAGEGTLFLDELGEMPLSMQVKLLRVLQERRVRPVGAVDMLPMKARVVCATNRKPQRGCSSRGVSRRPLLPRRRRRNRTSPAKGTRGGHSGARRRTAADDRGGARRRPTQPRALRHATTHELRVPRQRSAAAERASTRLRDERSKDDSKR